MTVYVDGVKKVINIEKTDTVQDLKTRLSTVGVDASIDTDGMLNLKASNGTSKLLVGATNDTSNIKSLLGISQQEDGTYKSTSAMYKATTASKSPKGTATSILTIILGKCGFKNGAIFPTKYPYLKASFDNVSFTYC